MRESNPQLIQRVKSVSNPMSRVVEFWVDSILEGYITEFVVDTITSYSEANMNQRNMRSRIGWISKRYNSHEKKVKDIGGTQNSGWVGTSIQASTIFSFMSFPLCCMSGCLSWKSNKEISKEEKRRSGILN